MLAIGSVLTLFECKDALPIGLHVDYDPFIYCRGVQGFVQAAEGRVSIIGVFAFRVGVMDDKAKSGATGLPQRRKELTAPHI